MREKVKGFFRPNIFWAVFLFLCMSGGFAGGLWGLEEVLELDASALKASIDFFPGTKETCSSLHTCYLTGIVTVKPSELYPDTKIYLKFTANGVEEHISYVAIHEGHSCETIEDVGREWYVQPNTVFLNSSSTSSSGDGEEVDSKDLLGEVKIYNPYHQPDLSLVKIEYKTEGTLDEIPRIEVHDDEDCSGHEPGNPLVYDHERKTTKINNDGVLGGQVSWKLVDFSSGIFEIDYKLSVWGENIDDEWTGQTIKSLHVLESSSCDGVLGSKPGSKNVTTFHDIDVADNWQDVDITSTQDLITGEATGKFEVITGRKTENSIAGHAVAISNSTHFVSCHLLNSNPYSKLLNLTVGQSATIEDVGYDFEKLQGKPAVIHSNYGSGKALGCGIIPSSPWKEIAKTTVYRHQEGSTRPGTKKASASFDISTGHEFIDHAKKVVVLYDQDKVKVGCGVLEAWG